MEVITIGTELLFGHTVDTNGGWIGARLAAEGFLVTRRTAVPDNADTMRAAISEALARNAIVICTGGLGPTSDDFTKPVVAQLYGRPLYLDEAWFEVVRERFAQRGIRMPEINRNQAEVPEGAIILHNKRGSAPGIIIEDDAIGTTILLPGVPYEMRGLIDEYVIPYLRTKLERRPPILEKWIRTNGIAESAIAERVSDVVASIAPLTVAFLPSAYGEDIRITCWGDCDVEEAERRLLDAQRRITECLQPFVYAHEKHDLAAIVSDMLRARGVKLAVAESCTGGLLAKRITDIGGASQFFVGGVVTYANEAKVRQLGVDPEMIATYGAVSEQCATAMAVGAVRAFESDVAVSITGIAGPGGGTPDKPVGTVWIGYATKDPASASSKCYRFGGDRDEIRTRSTQAALITLMRAATLPVPHEER